MNKLIKILIFLIIINIIILICLLIYNNKLTKNINSLDDTITFIDEGGGSD